MKIQKILKNSFVLLRYPQKRKHFLNYLIASRVCSYKTANLPFGTQICCTSFSEYLSIINLQPSQPELEFMRARLKEGKVAFDVGANVGSWSVLMHKLNPECQIFAFEPIPKIFELLKINGSFNSGEQISAINAAVCDYDGEMDFQVPGNVAIFGRLAPKNASSFSDSRFAEASVSKVQTARLDNFCASRNIEFIDFLKIDVEGFELAALRGLGDMIYNKRVSAIHIETIRENHERAGECFDSLLKFLHDCGYSFYSLSESGEAMRKVPINKIKEHNHVCLPN